MRSRIGDGIMWMHDTLAYTPLDNDPGFYNNGYVMIDPFISYHNEEKNIKYIINSRYFHKFYGPFENETLGQIISTDSTTFSRVAFSDFQVQKIYKEGLSTTSGYTLKIEQGSDQMFMEVTSTLTTHLHTGRLQKRPTQPFIWGPLRTLSRRKKHHF